MKRIFTFLFAVVLLVSSIGTTTLASVGSGSDNNYELLEAAFSGDYAALDKIIKENPDELLTENNNLKTLLHVAAEYDNYGAIKPLIAAGLDVNKKDDFMQTPLDYAIYKAGYDTIATLIESGAKIKEENIYDILMRKDLENALELLLKNGADPNFRKDGYWPLNFAHNDKQVGLLIKYGADPLKREYEWCCSNALEESVKFLNTSQLKAIVKYGKIDIKNYRTRENLSLYSYAINQYILMEYQGAQLFPGFSKNFLQTLQYLKSQGLDINGKYQGKPWMSGDLMIYPKKMTPLEEMLDLLLGRFVTAADIIGIKHLLALGADPNVMGEEGTPLHWAATRNQPGLVDVLLKNGAKVNIGNKDGDTPLHYSSENSAILTKKMLKAGADVNAKNKKGETAVHRAAATSPDFSEGFGSREILITLKSYGANINAKTNTGWTPLHHAVKAKNEKLVSVLLNLGANPSIRDKNGATPLSIAAQLKNNRIINILKSKGAKR